VKQFAPEYKRNEKGWIIFPSDTAYRAEMLDPESNKHQAKANVWLIQSCIEYVSTEGQMLLDPFGGTGTLMIGALVGRDVTLIEISPKYHALQQRTLAKLEGIATGCSSHISLMNLPLQQALPIPNYADHIITSPPYAGIMKSKGTDKLTTEKTDYDMAEYTFTHPQNLGLMADWMWAQQMELAYKKFFDSTKPGGTLTLILKDHMKDRQRVRLTQAGVDACIKVGYTLDKSEWFKWAAPGSVYTHIYRARGWEVVDDEDVVVLRRPL
jgi:16S rRNA G966 N2-methylase RsmD